MSFNPFKQANDASKLSVQQIQQGLHDGTIPSYIGIPLVQEKIRLAQQAKALAAGQQKPPTVAEQVMLQAQQAEAQNGLEALPSNLPTEYHAAGGIIAFGAGGEAEDDDVPTFQLAAEEDEAAEDAEDEALYSGLGRLPAGKIDSYAQAFEQGIGSLPAAEKAAGKEDTAGFIERILHKESRGRRYGKDGELLTSEKGAKGEMQVMPNTSRDPGFGVKAARDDSPDELARVGRDYAQVMLNRYGDPKIAAIAYNMGPGATDKWLAAGADFSKLPKETQGYVRGFAKGGPVHFQNLGLVEDDFTTIPGLYQSNEYERALRRAKGIPEEETKPRYTPGELPKDMQMRMDANYRDVTSNPGILAGTTYADALAKAKGTPPAVDTSPSLKETLLKDAAAKQKSREYVADKISDSDYARQMGNVGGFFGDMGSSALSGLATLGKHIVSAPGYGFSSQNRPESGAAAETKPTTPATQQKASDLAQFEKATERFMNDREQARLANAHADEQKIRAEAAAAKAAGTTPAGTTPAVAEPVSRLESMLTKREANLEKQKSIDNYMALLSAGLGMMGGTSQHAFANIGAGAQQGINNLLQSNKLRTAEENAILTGRLGQERYKNSNALQEARLAESKLNRERLSRADLADNLRSHEQQARRMAITQIGQDKLGALDPAAQAAAIDRKAAEILNNSAVFQTQMREYMGSGYIAPQQSGTGGANWSYDPKNRKLSGS